jgi:hypothetical protein
MTITGLSGTVCPLYAFSRPDPNTGFILYFQKIETGRTMTITGLSGMVALCLFQQASGDPDPGVCGSIDPNTGFLLYFQKIEEGRTMTITGLSGMSALCLFQQASAELDLGVGGSVSEQRVSIVLPENRNRPDHDNHWALRHGRSTLVSAGQC